MEDIRDFYNKIIEKNQIIKPLLSSQILGIVKNFKVEEGLKKWNEISQSINNYWRTRLEIEIESSDLLFYNFFFIRLIIWLFDPIIPFTSNFGLIGKLFVKKFINKLQKKSFSLYLDCLDNIVPKNNQKSFNLKRFVFEGPYKRFLNDIDHLLSDFQPYIGKVIELSLFSSSDRQVLFYFLRRFSDLVKVLNFEHPLKLNFLFNDLIVSLSKDKLFSQLILSLYFSNTSFHEYNPLFNYSDDGLTIQKKSENDPDFSIIFSDKDGIHFGFFVQLKVGETIKEEYFVKRFHDLIPDYNFQEFSSETAKILMKNLKTSSNHSQKSLTTYLNLKEPFMYKLLEKLNLGPKVAFVCNPFIKFSLFIVSRNLTAPYDSYPKFFTLKSTTANFISKIELDDASFIHLISLLFHLSDLKHDNIGVYFETSTKATIKIIDFLTPPLKSDYIIPNIKDKLLKTQFIKSKKVIISNLFDSWKKKIIKFIKLFFPDDVVNHSDIPQIIESFSFYLEKIKSETLDEISRIPSFFSDYLEKEYRTHSYLELHGYNIEPNENFVTLDMVKQDLDDYISCSIKNFTSLLDHFFFPQ